MRDIESTSVKAPIHHFVNSLSNNNGQKEVERDGVNRIVNENVQNKEFPLQIVQRCENKKIS